MSIQLQIRRDTDTNLSTFTGAAGEVVMSTTTNRLRTQDGSTSGGFPHALLADFAAPPALGSTTPAAVSATTLSASGAVSGAGFTNLFASPPALGATAPAAAKVTTLTCTSTATFAAGTTTVASMVSAAGSLLTTAAAGATEFDGTCFYDTNVASNRAVTVNENFACLNAAYTLTSTTSAQKLFNNTSNGQLSLPVGTYFFECMFQLSSLSGTSGSFGFALGAGTATIGAQMWEARANKSGANSTAAATADTSVNTGANTAIAPSNANTIGWASIKGMFTITVAGTIIPQVSLGVANAAVVSAGSFFKCYAVSPTAASNIQQGNWS